MLKALEFYSGIGSFSCAARRYPFLEVIAAFDQSQAANKVFAGNFALRPNHKNLDTIKRSEIPEADLWWMSPPCTPYTVRGRRRDLGDARARSFINLISHMSDCLPETVIIENVIGFAGSQAHALLLATAEQCGYFTAEIDLCSTQFGVPMRRPRHFIVLSRSRRLSLSAPCEALMPLSEFIDEASETDCYEQLLLSQDLVEKYSQGMNIVTPGEKDATLICFTRGYFRCLKASGSMIQLNDGRVRRVSPEEMLRLFGFPSDFFFPDEIDLATRFALIGNSVHLPAIEWLLAQALAAAAAQPAALS